MKEWFTASELASLGLPQLPSSGSALHEKIVKEGWRKRKTMDGAALARRRAAKGGGWEYHYTILPVLAQERLVKQAAAERALNADSKAPETGSGELWAWFERQPQHRKDKARNRLEALLAVEALQRGGIQKNVAVHMIAKQFSASARSLFNWFDLVAGRNRSDWLPSLCPRNAGSTAKAELSPEAWEAIKTAWLRDEAPTFKACWEDIEELAKKRGWTLPNPRTVERRLQTEIHPCVIVLCREGPEALKRMYPWQERDRSCFHALEAVNADGHTWDVRVLWPDGVIDRPVMVAVQDLYSNKILGWRIDRTENQDVVRLAFADVFRKFGIPDHVYLDNGRAFAGKYLTGGTPTRFRFKVKAEEPLGVLTALDVQVHWTLPYSGQSKPIERAFGELAKTVAKHLAFSGAYTGNAPHNKPANYGETAVPLDVFLKVIEAGIERHNARQGRRTQTAAGRSFDETFKSSYENSIIRRANPEQLRMCLLAAEAVRADKESGAVKLAGNRYWSEELAHFRGQLLTLRFDPDDYHAGVYAYAADGRAIGYLPCLAKVGYRDRDEGRAHNRDRRDFAKGVELARQATLNMSVAELAAMLPTGDDGYEDAAPEPAATRLVHTRSGAVQKLIEAPERAPETIPDFDERFARGLEVIRGGRE